MPEPSLARDALAIAHAQLARLRAGDVDAFLAEEPRYHEACLVALREPVAPLHELAALHAALRQELQQAMDTVAARMSGLANRRRAASAYLAAPPLPAPLHASA